MELKEKLEYIAVHYGLELQLIKLGEEISELTAEVCKAMLRRSVDDIRGRRLPVSLVWELADVEVMIRQIKYLAGLDEVVENVMRTKVDRQLERIKEDGGNEKV